jgi:hypothetical protein
MAAFAHNRSFTSHRHCPLFQNCRMLTPPSCSSRRLCSLFQNGHICSRSLLVLLVVFAFNSKMAAYAHSPFLYFLSSLLFIPILPHAVSMSMLELSKILFYYPSSILLFPSNALALLQTFMHSCSSIGMESCYSKGRFFLVMINA